MTDLLAWALWIPTLVLAVPAVVVAAECVLAWAGRVRATAEESAERPPVAVLIPANDEEENLGATLSSVKAQLRPGDRCVVVADNCTDGTADIAREAGVDVVERFDADRRGKGFALARGMEAIDEDPRDIVVMLDADCRLEPHALDRLARAAHVHQAPIQGSYWILPASTRGFGAVSAFAIVVKNHVRPLGLHRLGWPCLLTGSGMAFPRALLRDVTLGSANIVEDCQLGIDLALAGHAPRFEPTARIDSRLPDTTADGVAQRRRWEHGLFEVARREVPRLWGAGLRRCSLPLIGLGLELCVPPLALLVVLTGAAAAAIAVAGWWLGSLLPALCSMSVMAVLGLALGLSWLRFARHLVPASALLAAPWYLVRKIPLYLGLLRRREQSWLRVARRAPDAPEAGGP